jgi:hypothetical protein
MYGLENVKEPSFLLFFVAVMMTALVVPTNIVYAQDSETMDEPFAVVFTMSGVDNNTGFVTNWVTANNVTNAIFYNASETDLTDNLQHGFIELGVSLPNGTIRVGDEYKACTLILKQIYLTCDRGFNSPTNRPEFDSIVVPNNNTSKYLIEK